MKINLKIALALLLLITVIAGYTGFKVSQDPDEKQITGQPNTISNVEPAVISIKSSGFIPQTIAIKKGTLVKWVSHDDDLNHKIASNLQPTSSHLKDLQSYLIKDEDIYTYMFTQPGTYKYHDELNPELGGTVIVNP